MDAYNAFPGNLILAINPRVPFTNIGLFRNQQLVFLKKIVHPETDRKAFKRYADETSYRANQIIKELMTNGLPIGDIRIIISRGGLVRPVHAGVYRVNDVMIKDLKAGFSGEDVVNLGGLIADELSRQIPGSSAYVADPVVVDEFEEIARVSGHPEFKRRSVFHALEQKAVARKYAKTVQKKYEELNLIVAQMGNGITVGAHRKGRVIDANQGLDGDGPFSPSRTGSVPIGDLINLCYSGKYTKDQLNSMITIDGGLFAYLGVHDGYSADHMAMSGNEMAAFFLKAMAYQVAKTIGAMYAVLAADVDAILLTGGMVNSSIFMEELQMRIRKIAPVHSYPNEDDVENLALNGYYILNGEITAEDYYPA
ncbi:MAG: butyrate kinase [Bacteroidia bacterium]|nr:butyrate kinase [Bacteroidia bacterium]